MLPALALLLQTLPAQNFPAVKHADTGPHLGSNAQAACPASESLTRVTLLDREGREGTAAMAGRSAEAWDALGCTRARLAADGALSREGPLMIAGTSWAMGAFDAFRQALSLRPNDSVAAEGAALLAFADLGPRVQQALIPDLERAVHLGVHTPAVLRACSEFPLRYGTDAPTALDCIDHALAAGLDSTWHLLRLARLRFREADTAGGTRDFLRAAVVARDTMAWSDIDWHLQWFLSPDELQEWTRLPDSVRPRWIQDRLTSRDVRDGQPRGARLAEHFKRLEYVETNFPLRIPSVLQNTMRTAAYTSTRRREYRRWQVDFDDRGVVWMRFGPPSQVHSGAMACGHGNGCSLSGIEVWRYDIDGRTMLITFLEENFSGTVEATRVANGVVDELDCGLDDFRCTMDMAPRLLTRYNAERIRHEDSVFVSEATTRDDNSPRGDKPVETTANLHRLWSPETGAPMALVTYALKTTDLSVQATGAGRAAAVDLVLRQWDPAIEGQRDTALSPRLLLPDSSLKRTHLTGFFLAAMTPGVTSWSLVATQPDGRRGRSFDVRGTPLGAGPLALSDLVLGSESQGLDWNDHSTDVALAPLDAVDRKKPVSLYYQIRSDSAVAHVATAIALYEIRGGVQRSVPALKVSFDGSVHAGINELTPTIDVSRLAKGNYRLEVQLSAGNGASVRRATTLSLW